MILFYYSKQTKVKFYFKFKAFVKIKHAG